MRAYITSNYGHGKLLMWREGRTAYISDNNGYAVATIEDSYNRVFAGYTMSGMSKLCYDPNTNEVREGLVPTGYCLYRLSDDHRHIYKGGGYGNPLYTCSEPDPLLLIAAVAHFGDSPESSNAIDYPETPSSPSEETEETPWYHENTDPYAFERRECQVAEMKPTKWSEGESRVSTYKPATHYLKAYEPSIVKQMICLFVVAPFTMYFGSYFGLFFLWAGAYGVKFYFEQRKTYRMVQAAEANGDHTTKIIPLTGRQKLRGIITFIAAALIGISVFILARPIFGSSRWM